MDYSEGMDESAAIFYIGHHETQRGLDVSPELIQHAQDLGVCAFQIHSTSLVTVCSMTCSQAPSRITTSTPVF